MAGIELSAGRDRGIIPPPRWSASVHRRAGHAGGSASRSCSRVAAGLRHSDRRMVIILGVDRILDMSRTAVNVTGDLVASHRPSKRPPALVPQAATNEA